MRDLVDYIKYHGYITSIRDKVDKDYVWFDICQKESYKDRNGVDRTNLSFFSARLYIEYTNKIELRIGKDIYVQGIPKGYVDKNGHRQNYIHVLEINGVEVNKEPPLYSDEYWNGKKIPINDEDPEDWNEEKEKEWQELIQDLSRRYK